VQGTRADWKARGLTDHFEARHEEHELPAAAAASTDAAPRHLQSFSKLRIKVMLDLLEDGV
jgi:hypothetical protein